MHPAPAPTLLAFAFQSATAINPPPPVPPVVTGVYDWLNDVPAVVRDPTPDDWTGAAASAPVSTSTWKPACRYPDAA